MHLTNWQWIGAMVGAVGIGLSKGGLSGLGILSVALFAVVLPARGSVGIVLPLLICGDVLAVAFYRRHAVWTQLWRLFPWAMLGIVIGYEMMEKVSSAQVEKLIGGILLALIFLQFWRNRNTNRQEAVAKETLPPALWLVALTGIVAGFTTMVANAAGPVMILYLLAMRLPKMEFIGTGAWYFLLLNLFKVPFSYKLGLINEPSLHLDAILLPGVIAGVVAGRWLVKFIDQRAFELMALAFTLLAALRLLL